MHARRLVFVLILSLFIIPGIIFAQEINQSTEEILNNVSSQQKPYNVQLKEEECKILGIFNCWQPKVDYVHEDRLPANMQIADDSQTFWQKIADFFQGLFDKSASEESGYGNTYLPEEIDPVTGTSEEATGMGGDPALEAQQTHNTVKNSYLPYALIEGATPDIVSPVVSSAPNVTGEPGGGNNGGGGGGGGNGGGGGGSASGGSTIEYAKSLVETGMKNCGASAKSGITKTLSCNTGCSLGGITSFNPIRCINGKVKPDVYLDLEQSANGNSWLQCVGFVIGVEQSQGRVLPSHNAKDYCTTTVPSGYTRVNGSQASPGDIGITTDGAYGHIFIILEKAGSGYTVAEANFGVSGGMQAQRIYTTSQINCVLKHAK